jgi:diguanylate cyclase (GGDEF)-like protein
MGKTVLLADAEQATASLVTSVLENRGHRVVTASGGKTTLDLVRTETPDLIIVGEQLDDIDGIGLIVKLRSVSRTIKVVFISNQWRESDLYQMLTQDYGVALVIHRPIKPLLFGAQIDSQLNFPKVDLGSQKDQALGKEHERQAILALRLRFRDAMPSRLAMLSDALQSAVEQPGNVPVVQEARRLAHNLKGTSSSCGFEQVSAASSALEKVLTAAQLPENIGNRDLWDEIELLFCKLRAEAEVELERSGNDAVDPQHDDANMAKILVVGSDLPTNGELSNASVPVKLIKTTAANALEAATNESLDAVLIDMETAGSSMTPMKIARELRSLSGHESLPLGFIKQPNTDANENRNESTHAGASLFLDKPLEAEALREGIEYLLTVSQGGRPRVLIVDDDPDFSNMIANTLGREGVLVRTINDPAEVLTTMEAFVPDLVLLDVMMPGVSGFDVCRMLRANSRWQEIPILFLTAQTELEARLAAFDAGGDDYLPKPVAPVELLTRVKVRLERSRFIRERADKDILSGLFMRRAFMEQVQSLLAEAARHEFSFTIALIDVDKFKNINDNYGHLAGDRVLAQLGGLLKKRFRVEDIRGRWGGEEFIVAFRHETAVTTKGALERALDEFAGMRFKGDHGEDFSVTFTAGLATYPEDGDTLEKLVHIADDRLYAGKEAGRNRIVDRGSHGKDTAS